MSATLNETIARILKNAIVEPGKPKHMHKCDICNDVGIVESSPGYYRKCICKLKAEAQENIKMSGLSSVLERYSFDNFNVELRFQQSIKQLAEDFVKQDECKWFFIGGQVGAGKTHICTAICHDFLEKGIMVKYKIYHEMLIELKGNAVDIFAYNKIAEPLKTVSALYIDDLFKTKADAEVREKDIEYLFRIIDARYKRNLITVISSEKTLNEIISIDEAIGTRIKEMCGIFAINISKDKKKNYRLKNQPLAI